MALDVEKHHRRLSRIVQNGHSCLVMRFSAFHSKLNIFVLVFFYIIYIKQLM